MSSIPSHRWLSKLIRAVWSDGELVDEDNDDTSEDDIIITWEGNADW